MEAPAQIALSPQKESPQGKAPGVTIVIPAYHEEDSIRAQIEGVHRVLGSLARAYEIIVVDDGSKDRTAERAAACACRLIRQRENKGYGAALKRGIAAAATELIVITDADGTYPTGEISKLLELAPEADMVVGARLGHLVDDPLPRRLARSFLRRFASFTTGVRIPDLNSGLRVLRRSQILRHARLLPDGFSFTTTITLILLCKGLVVTYAPISYKKRIGPSKVRPLQALRSLFLILRMMTRFKPWRLFLPAGLLLFGAGALALLGAWAGWIPFAWPGLLGMLAALLAWGAGGLWNQRMQLLAGEQEALENERERPAREPKGPSGGQQS